MKTSLKLATFAAVALLTACSANAEKKAADATKPDPTQKCSQFAQSQFQQQRGVSGTTVSSSYDATTGMCTVTVENKSPGNSFSSRISTNSFDSSTPFRFYESNEAIVYKPRPTPHRLICESVTEGKNGNLVCKPFKPTANDMVFTDGGF